MIDAKCLGCEIQTSGLSPSLSSQVTMSSAWQEDPVTCHATHVDLDESDESPQWAIFFQPQPFLVIAWLWQIDQVWDGEEEKRAALKNWWGRVKEDNAVK